MSKLLVTNNDFQHEDYKVINFTDFWNAAQSEEGIDDEEIYVDVNSIPKAKDFNLLNETGIISFFSFDGSTPDFFNAQLVELDLDSKQKEEELSQINASFSLMDQDVTEQEEVDSQYGRVVTFGSAKGGSGKTFTSLISAYYYAIDHPNERVAMLDLDIEEPQLGLALGVPGPTVAKYLIDYEAGDRGFDNLKKCAIKMPDMPQNLEFYLAPRGNTIEHNQVFWNHVMYLLFSNYDTVVVDTSTFYMAEDHPVASAYRLADKIILVSAATLSSTITVGHQVDNLTARIPNNIYFEDDQLSDKINIVLTGCYDNNDQVCTVIIEKIAKVAPIVATFGYLTPKINGWQILRQRNIFDNNKDFREAVRSIMA